MWACGEDSPCGLVSTVRTVKPPLVIAVVVGAVALSCARKAPTSLPSQADIPTLQPVAAVDISPAIREASGICYDKRTGLFLVVSDDRPEIFVVDPSGRVTAAIATPCTDLEGIALSSGGDTLFVVEERAQLVVALSREGFPLFTMPVRVATAANHALEGIAQDGLGNLFIINEKDPRLLLYYRGSSEVSRAEIRAFADLSDICYDAEEHCLWLISDESLKIGKFTTEGVLLREWFIPFSKGEGIAVVGSTIYVVRDGESKLYLFEKP